MYTLDLSQDPIYHMRDPIAIAKQNPWASSKARWIGTMYFILLLNGLSDA